MNKSTVLLVLILSIFLNLNAQKRTNDIFPKEFISKSPKLTSAIGWKKNIKTGQWIDNKNLIHLEKNARFSNIIYDDQNFKSIQFSKLNYLGKDYYVFLYKHLDGIDKKTSYKGMGRMTQVNANVTQFFVIPPKQYKRLKKEINSNSGRVITICSEITGKMSDKNETLGGVYIYDEENLILEIIEKMKKPSSNNCFLVNSQIIEGKELVRFQLPVISSHNIKRKRSRYKYDWQKTPKEILKNEYFEVKLSEFKTILIE